MCVKEGLSEIFFEEYGFKSLFRTHAGDLSCYQNKLGKNKYLKLCFNFLPLHVFFSMRARKLFQIFPYSYFYNNI